MEKCPECGQSIRTSRLAVHRERVHGRKSVDALKEGLSDEPRAEADSPSPLAPDNGTSRCPICNTTLQSRHLQRHLSKVHRHKQSRVLLKRLCFRCSRIFTTWSESEHYCSDECRLGIKHVEPAKPAPPPPPAKPAPPLQQCRFCECWVKQQEMDRHLKRNCPHSLGNEGGQTSAQDLKAGLGTIPVAKLSFRLLPPGSWNISHVVDYYSTEAQLWLGSREIQPERLRKLISLNPARCYVGTELWVGYILFEFTWCKAVVLECPIEGNASYIILGDWKKLAGFTKRELLNRFSRNCTRVVHKGEWLPRVREALTIDHVRTRKYPGSRRVPGFR